MYFFDHVGLRAEGRYFLLRFMVLYKTDEVIRTNKEFCTEFDMNDRRVSQALADLIKASVLIARPISGRGRPKYAYSLNNEHLTVSSGWALIGRIDPVKLKSVIHHLTKELCNLSGASYKGGIGPYLVLLIMLLRANSQGLVKGVGFNNLSKDCGLSEVSVKNGIQKLLMINALYLVLRGGPAGFGLGRVRSIYQINLNKVSVVAGEDQHTYSHLERSGLDLDSDFIGLLTQLKALLQKPLLRLVAQRVSDKKPAGLLQYLVVSLYDFDVPMKEVSSQLNRFLNIDHQLLNFYQQLFEYIGQQLWWEGVRFYRFSEADDEASAYMIKVNKFERLVLEKVFSEVFEGMATDDANRLFKESCDVKFLVFLSLTCMAQIKNYQLFYPKLFEDELVSIAHSNKVKGSRVLIFSKLDK